MPGKIVIVGANGKLGRAVMDRVGPVPAIAAVRRIDYAQDATPIGEAGFLRLADLAGTAAVVNCAGTAKGTEEELCRANVTLAESLARQAKAAGVPRFVQISSFAVFGRVERIAPETESAPDSAYGRSKREAERRLLALRDTGFEVVCLRLPFMFSPDGGSLLARLTGALTKLSILPIPAPSAERSMITFEDAAFVVGQALAGGVGGAINAADPKLFSFALLRETFAQIANRRLWLLPVPKPAERLIGLVSSRLRDSLFSSNILDPRINFARDLDLPLGMDVALAALVRRQQGGAEH
jgi:nucleoside-diphosphate-sugar epimerase